MQLHLINYRNVMEVINHYKKKTIYGCIDFVILNVPKNRTIGCIAFSIGCVKLQDLRTQPF
jgi:hypothetical protein